MPIYEYKCQNCGYYFEASQKITAEPLEICPKCQGMVKRLIPKNVGIVFKGSGFHITDYVHKPKTEEVKPKEKVDKKPPPTKKKAAKDANHNYEKKA